ncbi:tetratricopeptide repeat protein [Thalassobaculum sp. OXR-137]|uniref:tetratricopeptide repeat protein n=1 Tax=Thalassobaculum sp. OXR-137 TaxID=3100173 RepID=UPI002AC967DF|nr:tetratricopeptide repeat protein [Thalassobaculum sp. OXR-137]WPZ34153.1 tetratricopeptide repeat protein [Thalassobaculum sp. OXR-137]
MTRAVLRTVSLLAVLLLWLAGPALAVPVQVSGGSTPTSERLVFDWPRSVDYSAERFGDSLVIRFSQPIEGDIAAAAGGLGRFISGGRIGSDGRSAVIELTGNHRLRTTRDGNRIVIDLSDRTSAPAPLAPSQPAPAAPQQAAPPPAPAAAPPPAQAAAPAPQAPAAQAPAPQPPAAEAGPLIPTRTGQHPNYDRIVFDWPAPVDFEVEPQAGAARILFARPGRIDDDALRRRLPEPLRGVASMPSSTGLAVTLPVPDGRSIKAFQSGPKVVVDVMRDGSGITVPPAGSQPAPVPAPTAEAQRAPSADGVPAARGSAQAEIPAAQGANPGEAPAPAAAPVPATPEIASQNNVRSATAPPPEGSLSSEPTGAVTNLPDVRSTVPAAQAGNETALDDATRLDMAPAAAMPPIAGPPLAITRLNNADAISLRFAFEDETAAVVFPRAGYVWVGFDRAVTIDTSQLAGLTNEIVGEPQQVPASTGSVVRIPVVEGVNPRVWRDGSAWVLDLQPQLSRPDVPLRIDAQMVSPQGPRLFIPVEGVGDPMVVNDPEVGDSLFLIPITPLSRGIDGNRRYPDMEILGSLQGVVVRPNRSDIAVRVLPDGIAITREAGMVLSGPAPRSADDVYTGGRFEGLTAGLPPGRIFDMANWRLGSDADFLNQRQALQLRISEATSISRNGPRLELAQFYFARGLAAEAIGLLRTIAQSDEDLANRPDVKALRGAASFMLGRNAEAEEYLDDAALNGFSEAELWRGAATAGQGKWDEAVEHIARAGEIPGGYPRNYTTELAMQAAEAAIRAGDFRGAGAFLDVIAEGDPTPGERARLDFLRGRVLYAFGDLEAALDIWNRLADGEDRWARVRSERALIQHRLEDGRITPKQAADRLDELRYAWRGDRVEFELLRDLGRLRLEENEFEEGLDALRQAVTFFPDNPDTRDLAFELTEAFSDIFTSGVAEAMTPLQALALYDQFRELTPVGAAGDKIIESLADRLVKVDLLDRAARLLDRQVKFRLQGTEKARVGARLALILLLDRQPESAIAALDESVAPGLGSALAGERSRLRARAIFDLGDAQGALKLLANDRSREAELLRADIYWRTQEWVEAAKTFRTLVGEAGRDGRRLTPEQANFIVNWAVSLALSDNDNGLNRLRQIYGTQMDDTPFREAFRLITNNTDSGPDEFLRLSERFEEIGRFQAFLSSYRDKLKQGPLSATN